MKPMIPAAAAAMVLSLLAAPAVPADEKSAEPEYQMTTYYVGFLSRGENWTAEETEANKKLQAEHLAHIGRMVDSGQLLLAGPFLHDGDPRGLFVFKTATIEAATALASADPKVKAGHLSIRIIPWYSAAGITIVQDGLMK